MSQCQRAASICNRELLGTGVFLSIGDKPLNFTNNWVFSGGATSHATSMESLLTSSASLDIKIYIPASIE